MCAKIFKFDFEKRNFDLENRNKHNSCLGEESEIGKM